MEDLKKKPNISIEAMEAEEKRERDNKQASPKKESTFDVKNYLNTRLDLNKGESKRSVKIRLLPIDENNGTPFKTIYTHNVQVPKEISPSGFKSYICLSKTEGIDHEKYGSKCPFCEARYEAYKKSLEADNSVDKDRFVKISLSYIPKESCIVRCIERGAEEDGPKFWKFNIRKDGLDPKHKIKELYNLRLAESREDGEELNILDIYNGKDLVLNLKTEPQSEDDIKKKRAPKIGIDISDAGKITPLSTNDSDVEKWVYDNKKWFDVFGIKTYEYLSVILNGGIPWFDRELGKWVDKDEFNAKHNYQKKSSEDEIAKSEMEMMNTQSDYEGIIMEDEDDLPY